MTWKIGTNVTLSLGNVNPFIVVVFKVFLFTLKFRTLTSQNIMHSLLMKKYIACIGRKKGNVLFNDALNTFYFTVIWRLTYGKGAFR